MDKIGIDEGILAVIEAERIVAESQQAIRFLSVRGYILGGVGIEAQSLLARLNQIIDTLLFAVDEQQAPPQWVNEQVRAALGLLVSLKGEVKNGR